MGGKGLMWFIGKSKFKGFGPCPYLPLCLYDLATLILSFSISYVFSVISKLSLLYDLSVLLFIVTLTKGGLSCLLWTSKDFLGCRYAYTGLSSSTTGDKSSIVSVDDYFVDTSLKELVFGEFWAYFKKYSSGLLKFLRRPSEGSSTTFYEDLHEFWATKFSVSKWFRSEPEWSSLIPI